MRNRYYGLDFLRGIGIIVVIIFHSAFYHYHDLYEIDFNAPPVTVTIIGLLLMFAGMFGMLSGTAHTIQSIRKLGTEGFTPGDLLKYRLTSGGYILFIAYLYFLFTGPGLVNFAEKSMDRSLFVQMIQDGTSNGISIQRVLYIDSLVMIGTNIILLGIATYILIRLVARNGIDSVNAVTHLGKAFFWIGLIFFAISYIRIPLYDVYLDAIDRHQWGLALSLNWLVNKNNPIMPFFTFALLGGWLGCLLYKSNIIYMAKRVVPAGLLLMAAGITAYINLPDTMLERSIDPKWYSIMTIQLGLFMLLILISLRVMDFGKQSTGLRQGIIVKFITRFGVAGLTPFFLESVVSELVFQGLNRSLHVTLNIGQALIYGTVMAILWGLLLIPWEKRSYRFSIEYFYGKLLKRLGGSEKERKLKEASN